MNAFDANAALPSGYRLAERMDLIRNRRLLRSIAGLSCGLMVLSILLGLCFQPAPILLLAGGLGPAAVRLAALCLSIACYIIAHEAVHGALMWSFSHCRPSFRFSLLYACAGSTCYFARNAYLCIALAPAVCWGVVLAILASFVPDEWFWVVWGVQITNISGSAGDLYVFFRMLQKPRSVLVHDTGTVITLYRQT